MHMSVAPYACCLEGAAGAEEGSARQDPQNQPRPLPLHPLRAFELSSLHMPLSTLDAPQESSNSNSHLL